MNKEQIFQSISKDYEKAFCCGRDRYFNIKAYIASNENLKNRSTEDKIKWLNSKGYFVVDSCFSSELMITQTLLLKMRLSLIINKVNMVN